MRTTLASLHRFAMLSLCAAAVCATGSGSSITTSASATAGTSACNQTGTTMASCNVNTPGDPNGPETATANATATWDSGGRLEAVSDAYGLTSSAASVSYSNMFIVTGASGSGDLTIQFTGFQDILSQSPAGGTVSPLTVTVGGNSTNVTFPLSGTFSATLPVNFGVYENFAVTFSDTAFGTMFFDSTYGRGDADAALLSFPTFVVTSFTGAPIPGATVEFVPEPTTFGLLVGAVPALWLVRRRTRRAQA